MVSAGVTRTVLATVARQPVLSLVDLAAPAAAIGLDSHVAASSSSPATAARKKDADDLTAQAVQCVR
jgi:hypothetical protein